MVQNDRDVNWGSALDRARKHSPFLSGALGRNPELAALLGEGDAEAALALARAAGEGVSDTGVALRRERMALATALAIGDLAGAFPVERVMHELSAFADRALDAAIKAAITRRVPDAEPCGFVGLALGKHGADELNYSSDIDPILLYDPDTLPRRERDEPGEAAQRYAREIIRLLSDNTSEGYVFRVDLRLRPASEVSPLAVSTGAALTHYESSALTWERAAFIRARAASGDIALGEEFLASIRPFIWRRSLDFGAIEEIERLTARIRANYVGPVQPGPDYNVKQGRGGIREVEFFAQTHQLIHGGRNPALRVRGTRAALDALAAAEVIEPNDAADLGAAYDELRSIEHRLQMVEDRQTHSLPEGEALDNVAKLAGYAGSAGLIEQLEQVTASVAKRFDRLIDVDGDEPLPLPTGKKLRKRLEKLGYEDAAELAERIAGWSDGSIRALRSAAAQNAFEAIRPALIEAFAEAPDPHRAVLRWEAMLGQTSSAISLFRLLEARPGLLDQLVKVLTLADPLADELGRRPDLLDSLIDRSALDLPGEVMDLAAAMGRRETGDDYERVLDRIRVVTGEKRFALGVQLIEGAHDPLAIANGLARVAEAGLVTATQAAQKEFAHKHGLIEGSELIVVGLGRLGGSVLTHASDLDIIYLYSGEMAAESDGDRPLGATLYYNRLCQRVSAALSVPTAQGALYEVDTRLRPQGAQGPLAVSLDSFARYQREDAWTWEHMALTRARVLVGSGQAADAVDRIVASILDRPRDPEQLQADILSMRSEMARHKQAGGALDAKLRRGGLVDLEFLVHFLQLRDRVAFDPDLGKAIAELVEHDLLPPELLEAYAFLTRLLVATRLLVPDLADPAPGVMAALSRACGCDDGTDLLNAFAVARGRVAAGWQRIFGMELETDA